jgi:hypothetical protein
MATAGKALVVGVAVLAAEAGLSWIQRTIGTEERTSLPAVRGGVSASRGYLLGQNLEEILGLKCLLGCGADLRRPRGPNGM